MSSPDSTTRARAELVDLLESQLNTLEKETFGCVTEAELCEYEDRRSTASSAGACRKSPRNDSRRRPR